MMKQLPNKPRLFKRLLVVESKLQGSLSLYRGLFVAHPGKNKQPANGDGLHADEKVLLHYLKQLAK
ncbi:hypothetical protein HHL17_01900 [Chitinophaga sp. G-6-1-13]|uniref:Uncharacterized protein n=1 Tax=Chitinophaga fulva TaxID=2728842 RepID=A0A848GJ77_9BACT|nr:hypothetical protein [Chitinophaga fulva]NML35938.1 hypothetical protein [Chitinophaga fulva]